MEDTNLRELIKYLKDEIGQVPNFAEQSYFFKHIKELQINEGLLSIEIGNKIFVIVPDNYTETLVNFMHKELCHLGSKKTESYMKDFFYWPNMNQNIKEIINKCQICAKRKIEQGRTKEILLPRTGERFLQQIVVDVAYMEKTKGNKKYMVVIIDRFIILVSLTATAKQNENTVVNTILNNWIYRYVRVFEGTLIREWMNKFGIQQEFSSPYQHQSNGLAERTIRTVRDMMSL